MLQVLHLLLLGLRVLRAPRAPLVLQVQRELLQLLVLQVPRVQQEPLVQQVQLEQREQPLA